MAWKHRSSVTGYEGLEFIRMCFRRIHAHLIRDEAIAPELAVEALLLTLWIPPTPRLPQVALESAAYVEITKQLQPALCRVPRPGTPKRWQCMPRLWRLGRDSGSQGSQP